MLLCRDPHRAPGVSGVNVRVNRNPSVFASCAPGPAIIAAALGTADGQAWPPGRITVTGQSEGAAVTEASIEAMRYLADCRRRTC